MHIDDVKKVIEGDIQIYRKLRTVNMDEANNKMLEAYNLAREYNLDWETAETAYFYAESLIFSGKNEEAETAAQTALTLLIKYAPHKLYVHTYNILGILNLQKNPKDALRYLLSALEAADTPSLSDLRRSIYVNISNVFSRFSDPQHCLMFLNLAKDEENKTSKAETVLNENIVQTFNFAAIYFTLKDDVNFRLYYDTAMSLTETESHQFKSYIKILKVMNASRYGTEEELDELIDELLAPLTPQNLTVDIAESYIGLVKILMEHGDRYKKQIEAIITLYKETPWIEQYKQMKKELVQTEIEYYKQNGDKEKYYKSIEEFYELIKNDDAYECKSLLDLYDMNLSFKSISHQKQAAEDEAKIMRKISQTDELTGLFNRHAFEDIFAKRFISAINDNTPVAMAILDVDFFKHVNDTYGHQAGDSCLKNVSRALKKITDENTVCMRYGGDEFIIMFSDLDKETIKSKTTYIRDFLSESILVDDDGKEIPYRISLTQGVYYGYPRPGISINDYIRKADDALYNGKLMRGCITFMEETKNDEVFM